MASGDFVSDIYVESGYVDNTYIEGNYVNAGYVSGIITGSANLTSSFTLTANAGDATDITQFVNLPVSATLSADAERTRDSSANISGALTVGITASLTRLADASLTSSATLTATASRTIGGSADIFLAVGDTPWERMNTWDQPAQTYWEGFDVVGEVVATASFRPSIAFTISIDGTRIRNLDSSVSSNADLTAFGNLNNATAQANISASASVTVDGVRTRGGVSLEASLGTMSIDGVRTRNANVDISSAMTFELDAFRTRNAATLQASLGSLTAQATRARFAQASLVATVDIYANMVVPGQANITSTASLTGSFGRIRANTEILTSSAFTVRATLGGLIRTTVDISALGSTLIVGTIYRIDPFRVYTVPTESRILEIAQESRKKSIKSENRVNTVTEETRTRVISSETRQLEIQSLSLLNVSGQLLDTRK